MKNYIMALSLMAGVSMVSCSDFLDKEPSTALPVDGAITSAEDLQYALNGVSYTFTDDRMSYPSEFGIYADLLTDNYRVVKGNNQSEPISKYNITKYDDFSMTPFYTFYKAISQINKALETSADMTGSEVDNIKGQLLAWRGLAHFDLARLFAHIPSTVDVNAANSGIPVADKAYAPDFLPTRSTLKETYGQIIKDLTEASNMMDEDNGVGYMNKWTAIALRARAYLYLGEYDKAIADAINVIENSGYKLLTIDSYVKSWTLEGADESIFELAQNDNYNPQRYAAGYYCDASGYSECAFNEDGELWQYFVSNPNDIRSKVVKDQTKEKTNPAYYPGKFPGRAGSIALYVNNPKIVRLAEMYLIAAEAYANTNKGTEAANKLNELRANRIEGYTPVETATIEDVVKEWTIEFFCENQSAFAYWRNKMSVTNQLGKVINYDNNQTILPIPQREIDINPDLKQNAGY